MERSDQKVDRVHDGGPGPGASGGGRLYGLPANLVKDMPLIGRDYKVRADKWQAVIDMMVASGELKSKHTADEYFCRGDQALTS